MANYIDDEILCEGYTHFEIDLYEDKQALAKLKLDVTAFMLERAKFLLGDDVTVVVEFEEGSLKTTVKVIGQAALVIATAVGGYGSFKEGIKHATADAAMLAQSANLELIFRTKTDYCDRLRLENRKGVLGRVDHLLDRLENISESLKNPRIPKNAIEIKGFNASVTALLDWEKKSDVLFSKIADPSTVACIAAGFGEELEKFPDLPLWAEQLESKDFKAVVANADPERAAALASASAGYVATLKGIRKTLQARMTSVQPKKLKV
jgi:hypothetical protein